MAYRGLPVYLRVDARARDARQLALFGSRGRVFAPYQAWEDYRSGLYGGRLTDAGTDASMRLLAQVELCQLAMLRVIREWPIAASVNLSNTAMNQRAWIGQAACCLVVGSSADETKRAWWQLADRERVRANACADEVIALWQNERI
jgi:hypothetical protein